MRCLPALRRRISYLYQEGIKQMKSFEEWSRNSVRLRLSYQDFILFPSLLLFHAVFVFFPTLTYTQGLATFLVSLEKGLSGFQMQALFLALILLGGSILKYKKRPVFLRRSLPAPNHEDVARSLFLTLSMRGYELRSHGSGLHEFVLTSEPDARDKVSLAFQGDLAHLVYPSTLDKALIEILPG